MRLQRVAFGFFLIGSIFIHTEILNAQVIQAPQSTFLNSQYNSPNYSNGPNNKPQPPSYSPPNTTPQQTTASYNYSKKSQEKELNEALEDERRENRSKKIDLSYFQTPEFAVKSKPYYDAVAYLDNMASGKSVMSLKAAFYKMESTYGNPYLSYSEYSNIIKQSADFIKKWLVQNGYSLKNQEALHYGIKKFMSDTLIIIVQNPDSKIPISKLKHLPFSYDYDDYKGELDHRNFFITKCLATGTGQCNSMPVSYLLLAEQLGAKAYLSVAPIHSFIKYVNNKGEIHNYEPTSNWDIDDQWYQDNLGVTANAKRSGIYLDTLNKQMIIADCMLQLATGYIRKYGLGDEKFLPYSVTCAQKYAVKQKLITAYFLLSDYYAMKLDVLAVNNHIKAKDIDQLPEGKKLHDSYTQTEQVISQLGYQDLPPALYDDLLQEMSKKGNVQKQKGINAKQKKSMFITSTK